MIWVTIKEAKPPISRMPYCGKFKEYPTILRSDDDGRVWDIVHGSVVGEKDSEDYKWLNENKDGMGI